jgi:hypothetical protein
MEVFSCQGAAVQNNVGVYVLGNCCALLCIRSLVEESSLDLN